MTTDVILTENSSGYYDISFTETGDIATAQSLDTAILMSLYTEQRASKSEVPEAGKRRGWRGNESTPGFEMGSKLWQFEQARITASNLAQLGTILTNSLKWMVEDSIAVSASVVAQLKDGSVKAEVSLARSSSRVDKTLYELWNNTGVNL